MAICATIYCARREGWKAELREAESAPGTGRLVTCCGHITALAACSVAYHWIHCYNSCGHKCVCSEDCDSFHLKWVVWPSVFLFLYVSPLEQYQDREQSQGKCFSLQYRIFKEEVQGGGRVFHHARKEWCLTLISNVIHQVTSC